MISTREVMDEYYKQLAVKEAERLNAQGVVLINYLVVLWLYGDNCRYRYRDRWIEKVYTALNYTKVISDPKLFFSASTIYQFVRNDNYHLIRTYVTYYTESHFIKGSYYYEMNMRDISNLKSMYGSIDTYLHELSRYLSTNGSVTIKEVRKLLQESGIIEVEEV